MRVRLGGAHGTILEVSDRDVTGGKSLLYAAGGEADRVSDRPVLSLRWRHIAISGRRTVPDLHRGKQPWRFLFVFVWLARGTPATKSREVNPGTDELTRRNRSERAVKRVEGAGPTA